MTRAPMAAVPGLSRVAVLPTPPARRAQGSAPPPSQRSPEVTPPTATATQASSDHDAPKPLARSEIRPRQGPRSTQATTMRPVTLSLPAHVVQSLRDRARRDGVSQPDVLMDALIAAQGRLPELLAHAEAKVHTDGLFIRRSPGKRRDEPLSTLSLRLLSPNVDAIDDLANKVAAPSRSALCLAALEDYLT